MVEKVELESVEIGHIRSEYVDWGLKSDDYRIRQLVGHLSYLLAEASELVAGLASGLVVDVEETTASLYSSETNRVLRVAAGIGGERVALDIVVNLAAPTTYKYPC
ncbi:hypothetical protein [Streptomyces sp. ME19-01-6]|uniref:hypothetical protein n=1 Tax=Streptomyces sp. ME19-01-6 TaxID=3028686 RepID=UPI0029ABF958|nr:hypothetical protein [Streptomyces sp. ME19-01-6]MDX3224482.1 hypothetical protein [Streptomyces sp. ME19-01-6]